MSNTTLRIDIPRHLQDYNGYCGPACALMLVDFAGSSKSPPVFAQNRLFKEVRRHAREHRDRRPVKSPAESLLAIVNDHTGGDWEWTKVYNPDPQPVASQIFQAIEEKKQPCLILVNEGMHWVVAFGVLRGEDHSPSGLLMRDPAWTGMPRFFGLSRFPEEPRIDHRQEDCPCMAPKGKNSPGTVHERFFTTSELISHRGLQGAPDHEGEGAIAIVPPNQTATALPPQIRSAAAPIPDARAKAGAAALTAVQKSGLAGRPDSPPEWNKALTGATAGEPTLVKHPTDERDDFFLVPLNPADPSARLGAWALSLIHI